MSALFRDCNNIAGLALFAMASAAPFGSVWAQEAAGDSARIPPDIIARCAAVKMSPPTALAAQLPAPTRSASDDQVKVFCARLGFSAEAALAASEGRVTTLDAIQSIGTNLKSTGPVDSSVNIERTTREDFLQTGSPTMAEFLRGLSEVGLSENGDNRGQNSQGYGITTLNLRNLGAGRTLVLFDGVRLADDPNTNGGPAITRDPNVQGGGAQNLNNVPMEVLAKVEILKDGGAAIYGGDAGGGAVNFTPRRDLNGVEVSFSHTEIPVMYLLPTVLNALVRKVAESK